MSDAPTESRWRALAEKAIGGPVETLTREIEGLSVRALYPRYVADSPRPWRQTTTWRVAQRVDHPDPEQANRLALLDLEGGADALTLVTTGSPYSRGFGMAPDARALDLALDTVDLDLIATRLDAGPDTLAAAGALTKVIEDRRLTSAALQIDFGYDPVGIAARTGHIADADALRQILDCHVKAGLAGRPLLADGRPFHEAGADAVQELAAVLAAAVSHLRRLEGLGFGLDDGRRQVACLLAVDAEALVGLAKVRALRRLWARVETACGLPPEPLRLHAETAWRAMTRYDPWVNVMRATAGIFAAGLGGADVVTALPFTQTLGLPDDGARRLARNAQRVLIDESHLAAVDDPSAGSGGLDALTDDLCAGAWGLFQEIEREGGIEASLISGRLAARIAEAAASRAAAIATLSAGLVGTSRFPSLDSPSVGVLEVEARLTPDPGPKALPSIRDAVPFERLRDKVEAMEPRPKVFLATLGSPAAFGPRATAAANFFAVVGLATDIPIEVSDAAALMSLFAASGTRVACLCGSDSAYADEGVRLVRALRDAGATLVLASGAPGKADVPLREAGVTEFIHDGCPALRMLQDVLRAVSGE